MEIDMKTVDVEHLQMVLSWVREPEDIFGTDPDLVKPTFRTLAKLLHPDMRTGETELAMSVLNSFYEQARANIAAGIYGKGWDYSSIAQIAKCEFFLRYIYSQNEVTTDYSTRGNVILRIPHAASTNDLMQAEVDALMRLAVIDDGVRMFFPMLESTLMTKTPAGIKRLNVLAYNSITENPNHLLSLRQLGSYYHNRLHPKQAAWIWRKLLVALDTAHGAGVVHGSINPDCILLEPEDHLLLLTQWECSTLDLKPIVAQSSAGFYPSEINLNGQTTYGLDLYMAAETMRWVGLNAMPDEMARYFAWIASDSTMGRVQDTSVALLEFNVLIHKLWGAPKYTPMDDLLWPVGKAL